MPDEMVRIHDGPESSFDRQVKKPKRRRIIEQVVATVGTDIKKRIDTQTDSQNQGLNKKAQRDKLQI